jgi:hypothetical protein
MMSDDLKQALVQLQLAALTRLASRHGITPNNAVLEQAIAERGIAAAYRTMHEPHPVLQSQPDIELTPPPALEEAHSSFLRRLAHRWFGL